MSKATSLLKKIALVVSVPFILLMVIGLGEIYTRTFVEVPPPPFNNKVQDSYLGWKPTANYAYQTENFPDNKGGTYPVIVTFERHGFRKWSTRAFDPFRKRILFIGDSYVESLEASDEMLFYSIIEDSLPATVFAFGSSGYGTTQEFMVLNQYIDSIKPDQVVLEMCANDFADNYWELEKATNYKVGKRRPYLTLDNIIEYHHARYWLEELKNYSVFLYVVFTKTRNSFYKLRLSNPGASGEKLIAEKNLDYPLFATSFKLTENTLKKMDTLVQSRGAEFYVFVADDFEPTSGDIKKLCVENHIKFIEGVGQEVTANENEGKVVRSYDGYHWNNNGQKIVANQLIRFFRSRQTKRN